MIDIHYIDEPFHLKEVPLKGIYVLDNYLEPSLHRWVFKRMQLANWAKTNRVRNPENKAGLPYHEFWGATFLEHNENSSHPLKWRPADPDATWESWMARWFNRKLMTDFGFIWKKFDYFGTNSQTQGINGTCHTDCDPIDSWNLSFLYYPNLFWSKSWGGNLNFYSECLYGLSSDSEKLSELKTGSVEFKPNRLLLFDGRTPHQADAPNKSARYIDRQSIVVRGSQISLVDEDYLYHAHDIF